MRPSSKRENKKKKRMLDPSRRTYRDILDKSDDLFGGEGGHILDERNRLSVVPGDGSGTLAELRELSADEEARRVAEAVGWQPAHNEGAPLSRVTSVRSDVSGPSPRTARSSSFGSYRSDSPETLRSPNARLLKSPELRGIDSPADSGTDGDSDMDEDSPALSAYHQAQKKAMDEARERALKAEEEEREREREAEEKKKGKSNTPTNGGGGGALALLDALGGGGGGGGSVGNRKTVDSRGRKLAGGYPIP